MALATVIRYLALMGCDRYLGSGIDAGVLIVTSPRNYTAFPQNISLPVTALVGNWGLQGLTNVMVTVSGAYQDTEYVNLPLAASVQVNFGNWTPTVPGIDSLWVTVHAEGDTNEFNDADTSRFRVRSAAGELATMQRSDRETLGLTASHGVCSFNLPQTSGVKLEIFNLLGQKVQTIGEAALAEGHHEMNLKTDDLPSGIYLVMMEAGGIRSSAKMMVVR